MGPSFRRNENMTPIPALKRYEGLLFRVARANLTNLRDVEVLVMKDDLTLVDSRTLLPYSHPEGYTWSKYHIPKEVIPDAKKRNERTLVRKLGKGNCSEVFIAMGKKYAESLPDVSWIARTFSIKVHFPIGRGPGDKAQALKEWLRMTT